MGKTNSKLLQQGARIRKDGIEYIVDRVDRFSAHLTGTKREVSVVDGVRCVKSVTIKTFCSPYAECELL